MDDSESDLSDLSSVLSEPDEALAAEIDAMTKEAEKKPKKQGIGRYFKPAQKDGKPRPPTPEPPKREPSPPHEFTLVDNDAIAFMIMFRSRFSECFAKSLPHYGPQDIERGVGGTQPGEEAEQLLCALLSLCLNRKKPVERGHYGRALEDAISEYKSQWPREWEGRNPLSGANNFTSMNPEQRLTLLRTLILWSLHGSEIVKDAIKGAYKQTRREDDRNQPKAVQPWFSDSWRRKYYLIEGQEDTHFRIYRENDGKTTKTNVWFSVAGNIDEAKALADKFEAEMPGNNGKLLAEKVRGAVPRWEAGEEKRKRKDYRAARKAAFSRPEPGFGMYEGRTRGKRMRYTFGDDDQEIEGDSSRAGSSRSTPFDSDRPTITASGRQVKSRLGGMYGESMLTDQRRDVERERAAGSEDSGSVVSGGRRGGRRAAASRGRYADGLESGSETEGEAEPSGEEWEGNEDEPDDESEADVEETDESADELMDEADDNTQESLVVQLRYRKPSLPDGTTSPALTNGTHVPGYGEQQPSPLVQVENAADTIIMEAKAVSQPTTTNGLKAVPLSADITKSETAATEATFTQSYGSIEPPKVNGRFPITPNPQPTGTNGSLQQMDIS